MDALALLCTLHADGPATLRRLRTAGCDSLAALEAIPVDQLSELLNVTPAQARRLEREARVLRTRVDDDPLEREEAPEGLSRGSLSESNAEAELTSGSLDRVDQELLGRVLDTVREDPASKSPIRDHPVEAAPESAPVPPVTVQPAAGASFPEGPEAPQPVLAAGTAAGPVLNPQQDAAEILPIHGLLAGSVDGLDAELCLELERIGIRDLSALVKVDCDDIAQRTGRSFAELRRLQFLARRQLPRKSERLAPRAPFGAGVTGPVVGEALDSLPSSATSAAEAAVRENSNPVPQGAPAVDVDGGPPPFGANIVAPPSMAAESVVPTRQRTEAPGMEHPVPVEQSSPSPRRFWEPRSIYEARTARAEEAEASPADERAVGEGLAVEGSQVDRPSIEATSTASGPTAALARPSANSAAEANASQLLASGPGPEQAEVDEERAEVLRWNFEIPAPGSIPDAIAPPGDRRGSRPGESEREDAAGPFA